MSCEKITFILGAGASRPYGMPTGGELKSKILELISAGDLLVNLNSILPALYFNSFEMRKEFFTYSKRYQDSLLKPKASLVTSFLKDFRKADVSIDAFVSSLEKRGQSEEALIGKLLIGKILGEMEENSHRHKFISGFNQYEDDWIANFIDKIKSPDGDFTTFRKRLEKFQFLTFNYDRLFETSIFYHVESMYGPEYLEEAYDSLDIVHIYGSLGELVPHKTDFKGELFFKKYNLRTDSKNLYDIATNLNVMYESRLNTKKSIIQKLKNSLEIYIFGFGFDPYNVDNLGFDDLGAYFSERSIKVNSTDIGISVSSKSYISKYFKSGKHPSYLNGFNCSALLDRVLYELD